MRKLFSFFASGLMLSAMLLPAAKADDYIVNNIESCTTTNVVNCTTQIVAVFLNGTKSVANLTGKHEEGKCAGLNGLSHKCSFNEWAVPGLKNEDGSNLIQTTGWIQPPSQSDNSHLPPSGLLFFVSASGWVGQKKINSPKCNDSRYNCNWSYDLQSDVRFEVTVRENSMVPAYTTGTLNEGKAITRHDGDVYTITYSGLPGMTAGILSSPVPGDETVPDKPDWSQQLWSIRTIDTKESGGLGIHGVDCHGANPTLMTDALWVSLPSFDKSSKEVSLDVNNPHFDTNGNIASGHFQAYFPKAFTECYWGLDAQSSASKANVSVTEDGGVTDIATLVVNADSAGLTVSANGFHYSSPHISIKLPSNDQIPVEIPQNASSNTPIATTKIGTKKSISIKCVKNKTTKIVTGTSPKCPKGFIKK